MKFNPTLLSTLLFLTPPATLAHADWIPNQGNPGHTGYVAMTTNPANYHLLWQKKLSLNDASYYGHHVYGLIVAEGKLIYSIMETNDQRKDERSYLVALDLKNGEKLWRTNHGCLMDITYSFGKILYNAQWCGYKMGAYDAATGKALYTMELPWPIGDIIPFETSAYYDSPNTPSVVSYDPDKAKLIWENKDASKRHSSLDVAVDQDYVVTREYFDNGINVLSRATGQALFNVHIPEADHYTSNSYPVLDNKTHTVYAFFMDKQAVAEQKNSTLYAIDLTQRAVRWKLPMQSIFTQPVVAENTVFSINKDENKVTAVNAVTGKIEWTWTPPVDDNMLNNKVRMVATSDVIFVAGKHRTYAVSMKTHQSVWQVDLSGGLALGDGKLFIKWEKDSDEGPWISVFELN